MKFTFLLFVQFLSSIFQESYYLIDLRNLILSKIRGQVPPEELCLLKIKLKGIVDQIMLKG